MNLIGLTWYSKTIQSLLGSNSSPVGHKGARAVVIVLVVTPASEWPEGFGGLLGSKVRLLSPNLLQFRLTYRWPGKKPRRPPDGNDKASGSGFEYVTCLLPDAFKAPQPFGERDCRACLVRYSG